MKIWVLYVDVLGVNRSMKIVVLEITVLYAYALGVNRSMKIVVL